jgi:hypothetical protein
MAELRAFIDGLRERSGVPYPLAPTSWASPRRSSRSGPTSPTPATPAASCTSVSARPAPSRAPRRSILNGSPRRQGWLIITRDSQIQDRRAEITAVRDHGARMVALAGKDATSTWTQLEVLMCQWQQSRVTSARPARSSSPQPEPPSRPWPSRSHRSLTSAVCRADRSRERREIAPPGARKVPRFHTNGTHGRRAVAAALHAQRRSRRVADVE